MRCGELAVLLAGCSIEQALVKAEQMRVRISAPAEPKGPAVTAWLARNTKSHRPRLIRHGGAKPAMTV